MRLCTILIIFMISISSAATLKRAPDNVRINQWAYLTAHNAFSSLNLSPSPLYGNYSRYAQQRYSIKEQMEKYGVRALMYDIWEFNPKKITESFADKATGFFGAAKNFIMNIF